MHRVLRLDSQAVMEKSSFEILDDMLVEGCLLHDTFCCTICPICRTWHPALGLGAPMCRHWAGPVNENIIQLCELHALGEVWHGQVGLHRPAV